MSKPFSILADKLHKGRFGVRVEGLKVRIEMDGHHRVLTTDEAEEFRQDVLSCIYRIDGIPGMEQGSGDPSPDDE